MLAGAALRGRRAVTFQFDSGSQPLLHPCGTIISMAVLFIVRRGALRRFHRVKQAAAGLPVDVIWDRRTSPQGATADARNNRSITERRQQPSLTWTAADFVVIEKE